MRLHLRRRFRNIFLFDSLTRSLALGKRAALAMIDDPAAPGQNTLGEVTPCDQPGTSCEIAFLLGCDIPPRKYLKTYLRHPAEIPSDLRMPGFLAAGFWARLLRRRG